jgi:hypothetical protein
LNFVEIQEFVVAKSKKADAGTVDTKVLFQFKITLLDVEPTVWRRIVVADCTLDRLHEYIQTSMGWKNSHLHQFVIKRKLYGDPQMLGDVEDDFEFGDTTKVKLSELLPAHGKRFSFLYVYDMGDEWGHEILYEGRPEAWHSAGVPACIDGEMACPPENCGGPPGYAHVREALSDKNHPEHKGFLEWIGDAWEADSFSAKAATKAMVMGLPRWG